MREYKNLSKQALKRLPMYMSYLKTIEEVTEYISSSAVAKALDLNDVQVRKDLAAVCKSAGIPKRGFLVQDLIDGISDFLGTRPNLSVCSLIISKISSSDIFSYLAIIIAASGSMFFSSSFCISHLRHYKFSTFRNQMSRAKKQKIDNPSQKVVY